MPLTEENNRDLANISPFCHHHPALLHYVEEWELTPTKEMDRRRGSETEPGTDRKPQKQEIPREVPKRQEDS